MKKIWPLVIVLFLFTSACGKKEREAHKTTPRQIKAEIIEIKPVEVAKVRIFSGTVRARNQITLSSKISGYVKKVFVREGDVVEAGSPIIFLDDRPIQAQLKALSEAKAAVAKEKEAVLARLRYAEANYRRFKNLFAEQAATKEELDRVEAEYKALLAQKKALSAREREILAKLKEVKSILPYTRIKSPVKGLVAKRLADEGSFVNAGSPLITLDDLASGFEFRVELDEAFLGRVKAGASFQIEFPALGLMEKGKVKEVVAHVDPQSRTFLVKLAVKGRGLRSGLYGRLYFPETSAKVVLIPWRAVILRGELTGVMVVEKDGLARFRVVRLGTSYLRREGHFLPVKAPLEREEAQRRGLYAEVLSGLEVGERIVTAPIDIIRDGDRVI